MKEDGVWMWGRVHIGVDMWEGGLSCGWTHGNEGVCARIWHLLESECTGVVEVGDAPVCSMLLRGWLHGDVATRVCR